MHGFVINLLSQNPSKDDPDDIIRIMPPGVELTVMSKLNVKNQLSDPFSLIIFIILFFIYFIKSEKCLSSSPETNKMI